jgi:hypothetical protein
MPVQLFTRTGAHAGFAMTTSAAGAALVLALAVWHLTRRELD